MKTDGKVYCADLATVWGLLALKLSKHEASPGPVLTPSAEN